MLPRCDLRVTVHVYARVCVWTLRVCGMPALFQRVVARVLRVCCCYVTHRCCGGVYANTVGVGRRGRG